jgi:hypothetical protein
VLVSRSESNLVYGLAVLAAAAVVTGSVLFATQGRDALRHRADGQPQAIGYMVSEDLESATIEVDVGAGELLLRAGRPGSALVEGEYVGVDDEPVVQEWREVRAESGRGRRVTLTLAEPERDGWMFLSGLGGDIGSHWDLALAPDIPIELLVDSGVGATELDLADVDLTRLDVDAGLGAVEVTLPDRVGTEATIDGGMGEIVVRVPPSTPARVVVSRGIGGLEIASRFEHVGDDVYVTPGFDEEDEHLAVDIDVGMGAVRVR